MDSLNEKQFVINIKQLSLIPLLPEYSNLDTDENFSKTLLSFHYKTVDPSAPKKIRYLQKYVYNENKIN